MNSPIKIINRLYSGKSLSSLSIKIPLAGVAISLFIATTIGIVFYFESQQLVKEQAIAELKVESQIIKPLIENFYRESARDIRFLSNMPPVRGIMQSIEHSDNVNLLLWQQRLQVIFTEFLKNKSIYKKISYLIIEDNVRAVVSVRNTNGMIQVIPESQLNNNIKLDSLKGLLSQDNSDVDYSEIIYQKNQSDTSVASSVFLGIPIFNDEKDLLAIVAVEVDFSLFINELKEYSLKKVRFYLANEEYDFIYSATEDEANKTSQTFLGRFPTLYATLERKKSPSAGAIHGVSDDNNGLAYYSILEFSAFGQMNPLYLVVENANNSYIQSLESMRFRAFFLSLSLVLISLAFSIIVSKRYIRALLLMTRSVCQYEEKGDVGKLPIKENDEIGILARSFQNLLNRVEQKSADQKNETLRAEVALARLHAILNSIVDAVININDKGKITAFNQAAEKIFGYREAEVLGENISLLMPRSYSVNHDDYIHKYLQSGKSNNIGKSLELPALRKDGEKFSMNLSISEVKTPEGIIFTGLIRDITVSKLMEAENKRGIQEAKEMAWRLDFALSAPKIGVWDYNINTGISNWDKRMYDLFGIDTNVKISPENVWRNAVHHEDMVFVEEQFSQVAKSGEDLHFEYRIVMPDKEIKYVETHAQVLKDDQEHYFRVVGTHRDITEQRNLQTLKQDALDMAEHALLLRSQFLASMSHEIRTPMNGVLGMLGLLEQSKLDKQQSHHLQLARSSAQSLLSLINDILDFSKIEAGKLELEILDFDIRSQLGDFAESMAIKAQEKGLELILDVNEIEFAMVKGDPSRLRQILSNLVGNSIKFTDSGEVLIKVAITEVNSRLQFNCTISDTGIGIPDNKVSGLFDSFTQVDASTTRKYGGTGLGLAIVKQLCELMSGDISVSSEEGKGSAFTFNVTFDKSEQSPSVMPFVDVTGKQILIVDDNSTNLAVLKGQLSLWGAKVTEAKDGFVALSKVDNHEAGFFDAAILDMQMPGMNGATLGERLKKHTNTRHTKLIMMTSMSERGDAEFFANLGFSAYFPKPTTTSDLFDALTVILDDGQAMKSSRPIITRHNIHALKRPKSSKHIAKNTRLLLVEDNRINQAVILGVLSNIGLSADVAGNGVEALTALNSSPDDSPYQLIIMDCQMPEMDGYETTKAIRAGKAKEVHRDIPVIAMTANAMKGDKEKCLSAGMSDYATKPVDADILHEKISNWLGVDKSSFNQVEEESSSTSKQVDDERSEKSKNESIVWDEKGFLKRIRNNTALAIKITKMFTDDVPALKNQLVEAIEQERWEDIIAIAHKITGSCRNLGGVNVANLTQSIERAAKVKNNEELAIFQESFVTEFNLFILRLNEFDLSTTKELKGA
ncbi:MAG: response regulator [Colwellia sp.]|nr:response regulator [Colwellia sp.]